MSTTLIRTEGVIGCRATVHHGEDWYDRVPTLVNPETLEPIDITDITFELFIRPSLNHSTRFVMLTSVGSQGFRKENPTEGGLAIFYAKELVEANLPLSNSHGWEQFCRVTIPDPDYGAVQKIWWKGHCLVLPAREAATV